MKGTNLTLPATDKIPVTPAFAALPPGATRAVVVLHEALGPQPEIDRVVERFAAQGYAAVAPDLFAGGFRLLCISRALRDAYRGEGLALDRIRAARAWLCAQTGLPASRVGIIGFCMGGGFALAGASGFGAVSTNYGDLPKLPTDLGPTIGCFGGRDRIFARNAGKLRTRLAERGVPHEVHVFPTVGHSFLTDGDHPVTYALTKPLMQIAYDPQVADEAWDRILAFFERHLAVSDEHVA